jgi:hypothetical protein
VFIIYLLRKVTWQMFEYAQRKLNAFHKSLAEST